MSSYFDSAHTELREAYEKWRDKPWELSQAFDAVEERVVFDCTVCAMMFPEALADLREAIHAVVLKYAIKMLPMTADPADFEFESEHKRRLDDLVGDLHTVFHEVAHRDVNEFNDNPKMPLFALYSRGDEERHRMVEKAQAPEVEALAKELGANKLEEGPLGPGWYVGESRVAWGSDEAACWVYSAGGVERNAMSEVAALRTVASGSRRST